MNIRLAVRDLETRFGTFSEFLYYDGQSESIALVLGDVSGAENVLCRVHSACVGGHVFSSVECNCREQMEMSQAMIQQEGRGVIIYLDQEGKGNGHLALMQSIPYKKAGLSQSDAYEKAGFSPDARDFRPATEILSDLGVRSVVLLTNNAAKAGGIKQSSISVAGTREIATPL